MNLPEFIRHRPCLEELEGFRTQKLKDKDWEEEDQILYLKQWMLLKIGKEMPTESKTPRGYKYQRGKTPIPIRKPK